MTATSIGNSARGACLCGSVTFVARFPTKWVAHCHCTMCQREHGAAFVTWVSVPGEQFQLVDPHRVLKTYSSSPGAERKFCGRCGSSLVFQSEHWPGEVHVARASFVDPLDREPAIHGYYDTHVEWFAVNDDLPRKAEPRA